jgi:general stress protein 26
MKKSVKNGSLERIVFSVFILSGSLGIWAQDTALPYFERDTMISAAKEIMETTRYCALITLDKSGHPQARTMDPFPPENDMIVWLGTNINSRKVQEINSDSRVTLYYEAPNGTGYVVIQGNAYLVDDPEEVLVYWKEEWDTFYPDKDSTYTLIKVVPKKLEIVDYMHGITSSSKTWKAPQIEF